MPTSLSCPLTGAYFTAVDLSKLAQELDEAEQVLRGSGQSDGAKFTSANMDDSGYFSVQVQH